MIFVQCRGKGKGGERRGRGRGEEEKGRERVGEGEKGERWEKQVSYLLCTMVVFADSVIWPEYAWAYTIVHQYAM